MASNIVNEIKETKTTLLKTTKKTYITDHPEILVVVAIMIFLGIVILEKKLKV